MNFIELLVNCGFYGNRRNSGLALYLKMLVLVTTISVPNFMLVSKSAQFTWNFEPCCRTNNLSCEDECYSFPSRVSFDLPDLSKKIEEDSARRVECYFAWEWKIISTSEAEHLKTSFWCRGQGDSEMVYWRQIRDWKLGRVSFCMRMHTTTSHGSFLGTRCSAIGPSNSHRTLCKS